MTFSGSATGGVAAGKISPCDSRVIAHKIVKGPVVKFIPLFLSGGLGVKSLRLFSIHPTTASQSSTASSMVHTNFLVTGLDLGRGPDLTTLPSK